jgi:hypothetical protein
MDGLRCIQVPAVACVALKTRLDRRARLLSANGDSSSWGMSTNCVMTQYYAMLQRNLLYTGITVVRGRQPFIPSAFEKRLPEPPPGLASG